jgi:uncharacterized protein YeaO (DUF488 family)
VAVKTRRWDDPRGPADGTRILVTRYRPRALPKAKETWDEWQKDLGPSVELLAAFQGKHGKPISWDEYESRYRAEMDGRRDLVRELAARVRGGETVTLLCSSACTDVARCHRTILRELVEREVG